VCNWQVLEAVCVILDVKPAKIKDDSGKMVADYWKPSVALLNEKVCRHLNASHVGAKSVLSALNLDWAAPLMPLSPALSELTL